MSFSLTTVNSISVAVNSLDTFDGFQTLWIIINELMFTHKGRMRHFWVFSNSVNLNSSPTSRKTIKSCQLVFKQAKIKSSWVVAGGA